MFTLKNAIALSKRNMFGCKRSQMNLSLAGVVSEIEACQIEVKRHMNRSETFPPKSLDVALELRRS